MVTVVECAPPHSEGFKLLHVMGSSAEIAQLRHIEFPALMLQPPGVLA